jgi:hypothetical protein
LLAFANVLIAYLHGLGFVALANESSASEATVNEVNHQYSKSYEFESDFIDYEARYLATGIKYFSFLRPLTELAIAQRFARFPQYHPVFRSCNVGSKANAWCGACPKCLFVYIILSPFLAESELVGIFGKNMLDDASLRTVLEKLMGVLPEKPFECVGSRDEVRAALAETLRQYEERQAALPFLLEHYKQLDVSGQNSFVELCAFFDENNHLPPQFLPLLKNKL